MDCSPLEAHIGYWLRFVSNHVSQSFSRKLEEHDVSVAEWVVLRELLRLGETNPSHLADRMAMTRGAISKLVERLVAKELVTRIAGESDRRYLYIDLTPDGRRLIPQLAALADQNDEEFFGHLSESQRQALFEILQDFVERHHLKTPPTE